MKKLFTLLLAVAGYVGTAQAAKLYVNTGSNSWWSTLRVYAWGNGEDNNNGWSDATKGIISSTSSRFGKDWYVFDFDGTTYHSAIVQQGSVDGSTFKIYNKTYDITGLGSADKYIIITDPGSDNNYNNDNNESKYPYSYGYYEAPVFRSNATSNWSSTATNMVIVDDNTLTYTLSKSTIDGISDSDLRFRVFDFGNEMYPSESGTSIAIAGSNSSFTNSGTSDNYFSVSKPSYDYDHISITAAYNTSTTTWTISADAFISKTISSEGVATFGSAANVDLSKAEPALTSAKKGKVQNNGTIAWTTATTLYGGEGALIEGTTGTYSIPVAASASADTENNDFVAITEKMCLAQSSESGYTNFILSKVDNVLGFYKVNSSGSWCSAGTAYLKVANSSVPSARGFFPIWDDTTGIDALQQEQTVTGEAYNLAGQRVTNPTKGLYIVNGKKIIKK